MILPKRITLYAILFIGGLIAGFLFLLRGCLDKYNERSALPRILYFENQSQRIVFTLVKFEKATSYSRDGGMVQKTVSTWYYLQCNDAVTGKKINEKKLLHHSDIKQYPVEILGATDNTAWIFINGLKAYDPFTLEQKADLSILETKNPSLKDRFPDERRFYRFDPATTIITFTAKDGTTWKLDTHTLIAKETDYSDEEKQTGKSEIETLLEENRVLQDSIYQQKFIRPSKLVSARQITPVAYNLSIQQFYKERQALSKTRDSLQNLQSKLRNTERGKDEWQRRIKTLQERSSISFSDMKVNSDTLKGKWFGLFSKQEAEKLADRYSSQSVYNETGRRQLYLSSYSESNYGETIVDVKNLQPVTSPQLFLDGGFLIDKDSAMPVHTGGNDNYLVLYRSQVGNDGLLQIAKLNTKGNIAWTFNTNLKEWKDYRYANDQLFILGTDNRELSGDACNVLWCIDLKTGKAAKYDFFTDK